MITLKKILAPTDFSVITVAAVGYALSLARELSAEVTVLHALPSDATKDHFLDTYAPGELAAPAGPIAFTPQPDLDGLFERKKQVLHTFLEERISHELLSKVKINPVIRVGKVAEEIVAVAKEEQCDLIVMTSHGGRLRKLLRGSFTDRVIRDAPCPVLAIQPWTEIRTEENKRVAVKLIDKWAA